MENFLKIINEIQDTFTTVGASADAIKLPQIVVLGSQSTGKSSVLESIVQQDFLPRGCGIVTRRPLIIQITQDLTLTKSIGSLLHKPGIWYDDFTEISREIIENTDEVCGSNKGISHDPITIKIVSPNLPTLTLVDLPGITKNPVGDQPEDIEKQTVDLVMKYVENPNSIILAVSPGNVDIANSEAIKIARQVDPTGARTIAVITKVDLMEKTEENINVLQGKTLPVKLGIVGVINRNQKQIDDDISIEECLENESNFFRAHFAMLASEMGTVHLTEKLCSILMNHVKNCLPDLVLRVAEQKRIQQDILDSIGPKVEDPMGMLADYIRMFCQAFDDEITGRHCPRDQSGGMFLRAVFETDIGQEFEKIKLPDDIDKSIEIEIKKTSGTKPALFTPNIVFDNLAAKTLTAFKYLSKAAIKKSSDTVSEIIATIGKEVFFRYPNLKREVHEIAMHLLADKLNITTNFINNYIKLELTYINTNHRLFAMNRPKIEIDDRNEKESIPFEQKNVKTIKSLLELYLGIIRYQLMDVIPKCVVCFLVTEFNAALHKNLIKHLFNSEKVDELIREDASIEEKRDRATKMLVALQKADVMTSVFE